MALFWVIMYVASDRPVLIATDKRTKDRIQSKNLIPFNLSCVHCSSIHYKYIVQHVSG